MALREQPYLPLYVQDFMTDEKLNECSAAATGVYIRLMCLMHKSETYGKILLKQKYKQIASKNENLLEQNIKQNLKFAYYFAYQLQKQMPFSTKEIASGLEELLNENVLHIEDDYLYQKRMVHDEEVSRKRSSAGSKGGRQSALLKQNVKQNENFASDFAQAKTQANSENEIEYVNENEIKKIDPYCSIEKNNFEKVYEKVFGQKPFMTNEDCLNFSELASTVKDFFETLEKNLEKTKKLDFKKIGYKPDAGWFLKPKNYAALRNGVYDTQIEENSKENGFDY